MALSTYAELKTGAANFLHRSNLTSRIPEFIKLGEDRIALDLRVRALEAQGTLVWKADVALGASEVSVSAGAYTFTPATAATAYAYGDSYTFVAEETNTGAVTADISSLGAKSIKVSAAGTKADPVAGDIINGVSYRIWYDGTDFLLSPANGALLPPRFLEQRSLYLDSTSRKDIEFLPPDVFWANAGQFSTGTPDFYTVEGDWACIVPAPETTYHGRFGFYRRLPTLSADADTNWLLANASGVYLYATLAEASIYRRDDADTVKYAALYEDLIERLEMADRMARFPAGKAVVRSRGPTP